jgi:hypothetical protein
LGYGLAHLKKLSSSLQHLLLDNCAELSDHSLSHLSSLRLQRLDLAFHLGYSEITNKGIANMKGLGKTLKILRLGCRNVTDEGLVHLKDFNVLEELDLFTSGITGSGLRHLKKLPIRSIELGYEGGYEEEQEEDEFEPTDEGLGLAGFSETSSFQSLERFRIKQGGKVTDAGVSHLGKLTALTCLEFDWCGEITGEFFENFPSSALSALKRISFTDCSGLTDRGIKLLCGIKSLDHLTVEFDQAEIDALTNEAFVFLSELSNLQHARFSGFGFPCGETSNSSVTIEAFFQLKQLPNLRRLIIGLKDCTDDFLLGLVDNCPKLREVITTYTWHDLKDVTNACLEQLDERGLLKNRYIRESTTDFLD